MLIKFYPPQLSDNDVGKLTAAASGFRDEAPTFCDELRVFSAQELIRRWSIRHDKPKLEVQLLSLPIFSSDEVADAVVLLECWLRGLNGSSVLMEFLQTVYSDLLAQASWQLKKQN